MLHKHHTMKISTVIHNSGNGDWRPVFHSNIAEEAIEFYRAFNEPGKVALILNPPIDRSKTIRAAAETPILTPDEPVSRRRK